MSRTVISAAPDTSIKEVIHLLADQHIGGLPVIDGKGKLVGVISETDLLWQESGVTPPPYIMLLDSVIYLQNPATYNRELHKALGQTAGEVMTKKVITIGPAETLSEAARVLHERRIHRLFVVDDNHTVIGVLTVGDIVRAMAGTQ
jgi:CBS domain-containing protein